MKPLCWCSRWHDPRRRGNPLESSEQRTADSSCRPDRVIFLFISPFLNFWSLSFEIQVLKFFEVYWSLRLEKSLLTCQNLSIFYRITFEETIFVTKRRNTWDFDTLLGQHYFVKATKYKAFSSWCSFCCKWILSVQAMEIEASNSKVTSERTNRGQQLWKDYNLTCSIITKQVKGVNVFLCCQLWAFIS